MKVIDMTNTQSGKRGFTLIELMLAMTFVAILLLSIALLTIQISKMYTRGLTMKELTQAGTEIADDIKRAVAASNREVHVGGSVVDGVTVLCTGRYSYIASNPVSLERGGAGTVMVNGQQARFMKIPDSNGSYCSDGGIDYSDLNSISAVELLSGGDRSLVLRDIKAIPTSAEGVYVVEFTLSTGAESELIVDEARCKPPADIDAGNEWCAIDTFTVVVRTGV